VLLGCLLRRKRSTQPQRTARFARVTTPASRAPKRASCVPPLASLFFFSTCCIACRVACVVPCFRWGQTDGAARRLDEERRKRSVFLLFFFDAMDAKRGKGASWRGGCAHVLIRHPQSARR
jgi:hypothetical protein